MNEHASPIEATIPWPGQPLPDDPLAGADIDRTMVFVPAIMSVGLLFSVATLVRDAFHWTGGRVRDRRTAIEAGVVASTVLGETKPDPARIGILSRPTYLTTAFILVAGAMYVAVGSIANFSGEEGYVRDIGWLLAISLGLAIVLGFLGAVSFAVFRSWPDPPAWTYGPLRTAPLSVTPGRTGLGPSWALSAWTVGAAITTGMVSLIVGSGRSVAMDIDRPIARWFVDAQSLDRLSAIDPFGATLISIGFVALIGLSAFRCRVMALTYPLAFLAGWLGSAAIREIVERPRPLDPGDFESFPSGHMVQAVFIAGLVPLALQVMFSDRRPAVLSRAILTAAVLVTAVHRLHRQDHWPLDALAGVTFGLTVVLGTHWVMAHRSWHRSCATCSLSEHPDETPWRRGVIDLRPEVARNIGAFGVIGALSAAGVLAVATLIVGLPADPEGAGLGSAISAPVQLTLGAIMGLAGLIALRWKGVAAVMMAVSASGLGLFTSVEYRPVFAVALAVLLMVPAVLTWLAWQPKETLARVAVLAVSTIALLTGTATGSVEIYKFYFGPTHPSSNAQDLDSTAEWLWLGDVDTTSATVTAGGLDPDDEVELRYWPAGQTRAGGAIVPISVGGEGVARFVLQGLSPNTSYRYVVGERGQSGHTDSGDDAGFTTFSEGPQDLTVVLGACARTGSNGAVYDAMVAENPDLYLALGDLHYGNLESTDPGDHIDAYGRSLRQPGQAALFSSVPTAYVWDDHDYGPNDADGSSPSREAVSVAYRLAVPHRGVDLDSSASIAQAFTVGRVRFVLTDTRSHRTETTMLGAEQLAWLTEELTSSAKSHALVVWVNPTPWIGVPTAGTDDWTAYAAERQTIANTLADAHVQNLVMVSGDAHMLAIDDGTNSGYATDGSPGFPLLHAGALDRPGSVKGGPYSHGAFPGAGQYGRIEIDDDGGSSVGVRLSGHTWDGDELVSLELEFAAPR